MINISSSPLTLSPVPANNCMEFCFDISGLVQNSGTKAMWEVNFYTGQSYSLGGSFIFAGTLFETGIDDWQVDLSVGGQTAAENFATSIKCHPNFIGKVLVTNIQISSTQWQVKVTWIIAGEVDNWNFDDSNLSMPIDWSGSNGLYDQLPEGFQFLYQVIDYDTQKAITNLNRIEPIFDNEGMAISLCIDFQYAIKHLLKTQIPSINTNILEDTKMSIQYAVKYGYGFNRNSCETVFSIFKQTLPIWAINASMNDYDGSNSIVQFKYDGTNFGDIKFMTNRPEKLKINKNEYDWLWVALNVSAFHTTITSSLVFYRFFDDMGNNFFSFNVPITSIYRDGIFILPSGQNIDNIATFPVDWDNVCKYEIQVAIIAPNPLGNNFYTRSYTFDRTNKECTGDTFYFLDGPGGYTRLTADKKLFSEIDQSYTEVFKNISCSNHQDKMLSKNAITNSKNIIRNSYEATFKSNEEFKNYLANFKASERKLKMYTDVNGEQYLQQVIVESGSLRIYELDGILKVRFTTLEEINSVPNE